MAVAIFVFAYLGPFGTYTRFTFGESLLYWAAAMAGNWVISVVVVLQSLRRLSHRLPGFACVLIGAVAAAVPGTLLIALLEFAFRGDYPTGLALVRLFFSVAVVHLVLDSIIWTTIESAASGGDPPWLPAERESEAPPILERLPADLRGELLHLRMLDHYLEVTTDRGSDLVLMRFGDALKELGSTEGMQVHRSHWIARKALMRIGRNGSRTIAYLSNGAEVPVSRSYVRQLREARWV